MMETAAIPSVLQMAQMTQLMWAYNYADVMYVT
jgi:hypothetical protein